MKALAYIVARVVHAISKFGVGGLQALLDPAAAMSTGLVPLHSSALLSCTGFLFTRRFQMMMDSQLQPRVASGSSPLGKSQGLQQ